MSSKTERVEKLTLKGRLNIGNAQKIYTQIKAAYDGSESLMIFLTEIKEMDLAFIQILYSLLGAAYKLGKKVSVFIDDPETIWSPIAGAGFETHFSIDIDSPGTDFRIEGIFDE